MYARDYRRIGREKLSGNWGAAVLAALVAALLGGAMSGGSLQIVNRIASQAEEAGFLPPAIVLFWMNLTITFAFLGLVQFIIGGPVRQGYCAFLLNQHDGRAHGVKDLFSQFHRFGDGFLLALLQVLFTFLWTLLFIIPGIVAAYRYAMAPYVMLENPELSPSEALKVSSALMDGHKWAYFCLDLSFIGWRLLNVLTFGIGTLWLTPYTDAAGAAFYREISSQH